MRLVVAVVLLLTMSGCLVSDDEKAQERRSETDATIRAEAPDFLVQDHDHNDPSLHAFSRNVDRIGYSNGVDNSGDPDRIPGDMYYTELAVRGDYVYLARTSQVDPTEQVPIPLCPEVPGNDRNRGGFSIINIRDPANPTLSGVYNALNAADIEVSHDNQYVFLASQRNCATEILGNLQTNQDPTDVLPRGIHVVDVSDPVAPQLAFFVPVPSNGPHTVTYHQRGADEYLYVCTYDLYEDPGSGTTKAAPGTARLHIYQVMRDPGGNGVAVVPINVFFLTASPQGQQMFFPHDAIPQEHPNSGQMLLYVAYWDKGVQVLDITDPRGPLTVVDQFTEFSPSSHNAIHQVRPFSAPIGDRHVTVAQPELISADETGYITILDSSDPSDLTKLGHWTLPGDLIVTQFDFSPHNFDLWDGKIALAHNHAGVWIIDVGSEADLAAPKTVGYYLDVEARQNAPRAQPWIWGVFQQDGLLYAADQASGLYVLQYTGP